MNARREATRGDENQCRYVIFTLKKKKNKLFVQYSYAKNFASRENRNETKREIR